ncbi:Hcp family type VI secretion system effector [Falsiroseomonas sp.]|uniref:Hcp family type VI secretion system effector n=1 Tax=Falsiroseomonas sp. TaxID=2870721 RepID=UPI0035621CDA
MAVDIFIKIEGAEGEAQDSSHKNEIDVVSWNWGMSQAGSFLAGTGAGSGTGKVQVRDLSFAKYVDKASTNLMLFCCNGKHVPEAVLTVRKAGESPVEYLKITMSDCFISSVDAGGAGEQDRLMETVAINFGKVKVEYTPQKADGTADAPTTLTWNVKENKSE